MVYQCGTNPDVKIENNSKDNKPNLLERIYNFFFGKPKPLTDEERALINGEHPTNLNDDMGRYRAICSRIPGANFY